MTGGEAIVQLAAPARASTPCSALPGVQTYSLFDALAARRRTDRA